MVATLTPELIRLADQIANAYFLPGADRDDVQQEARIAAWVAVTAYDPAHGKSLRGFVAFVVHKRLQTAVSAATRMKHEALNHARGIVYADGEPINETAVVDDAHRKVVAIEELRRIRRGLKRLTPLERRALADTLNGVPQDKQADNAMWRARRKLARAA